MGTGVFLFATPTIREGDWMMRLMSWGIVVLIGVLLAATLTQYRTLPPAKCSPHDDTHNKHCVQPV